MKEKDGSAAPSSPVPKRILSRLTPVKYPSRDARAQMLISPPSKSALKTVNKYGNKRRTLSASDVLDKVSKFREQCLLDNKRRQEQFNRRLQNASVNRKGILDDIRESARRFSNDSRIFGRYKYRIDTSEYKSEKVFDSSSRHSDKWDEVNEHLNTLSKSKRVIFSKVQLFLAKKKVKNQRFIRGSLTEALRFNSFEELIELSNSPDFKCQISYLLKYFNTPTLSTSLPTENMFIYSIIMLADHHSSDGFERAYDTTLGDDALQEFRHYDMEKFHELYLYHDRFYSYIVGKFLRVSRRLLISFKAVLSNRESDVQLYDAKHLRFLNVWRSYVDVFHIFTNFHSKRSLLLLVKALDILESGIAIQEHLGGTPHFEYKRRAIFQKQKKSLQKQIVLNDKRNNDLSHSWFTLGYSFEERVQQFYEKFSSRTISLDQRSIVPPGFTLEQWRRFRYNRAIKTLHTEPHSMQTGWTYPLNRDEYQIEKEIQKVGLESFRKQVEGVSSLFDLVELNKRLFSCIGEELTPDQERIIQNRSISDEEEYLLRVQELLKGISKTYQVRVTIGRNGYLNQWRKMMNHYTKLWIDVAIERCPSYFKFEMNMFVYDLSKTNLSLQDYIEELKVEIPKRNVSLKTLLLEHIIGNRSKKTTLRTLGTISPYLQDIFEKLKDTNSSVLFLYCIPRDEDDTAQMTVALETHFQFSNDVLKALKSLKELLEFHFFVYHDVYKNIIQ